MENISEKRRRARSDKGKIRTTERDIECITWIAEQYAARGDQIQRLLSRYPDPVHPRKEELVSPSSVREQISRWVHAGWIVYDRILAKGPGWAYVTRKGLHLAMLHEKFRARPPSTKLLNHIYAINQVRLWMDVDEETTYNWKSERYLRAERDLAKGEGNSKPIPDAEIRPPDEGVVAIEVQISPLKPSEWDRKLRELYAHYDEVCVYVPTEAMQAVALAVCEKIIDDEDKLDAILQEDLLMPNVKWI
jgi:hypothetical protein